MNRTCRLLPVAALALAAGCPRGQPAGGAHPAATPASAPSAPREAAPARATIPPPPAVVRSKVEPLPLELTIDRGEKPAPSPELVAEGMKSFQRLCATCHGAEGRGDGPAAWAVQPHPRNFTRGLFKLHANGNGSLPTDEDLFDTITRGMSGSAMPSFGELPAKTRWELVAAVKELTVYKDPDEEVEIHFFKDRPPSPPADLGPPIPESPEVLAKGKGVYLKLDCNKCHGAAGDASGPSATDLKDDWGEVIWPRNFQEGRCRGVKSIRNFAERVDNGLTGTPMAAFGNGQMSNEEKWAVGHYLASLRRGVPVAEAPKDGVLVASKNAAPAVAADLRQTRFWMDTPVYEVALQGEGPKTVRIAVQRDATQLLLLAEWDDPIVKGDRSAKPEEFLDAFTVELSANGTKNSWQWRGEWQRDGKPSVVETPAAGSKLSGYAKWQEGTWHVLIVRPLAGNGERLPLEGKIVDVKLSIEDHGDGATRSSASGALKIGVP